MLDRSGSDSSDSNRCGTLPCSRCGNILSPRQVGSTGIKPRLKKSLCFVDRNSPTALFAILNGFSGSCLLRPSSPYGKLISLCSATLLRDAVDYHLHLSVLLKGARGTGKFTTACWVAQRIGMHLLEVLILCPSFASFCLTFRRSTVTTSSEKMTPRQKALCGLASRSLKNVPRAFFFFVTSTVSPKLLKFSKRVKVGFPFSHPLTHLTFPEESVLTAVLRECIDNVQKSWRITGHPVMVFATTAEADRVPMGILSCFKHEVAFEVRSPAMHVYNIYSQGRTGSKRRRASRNAAVISSGDCPRS